MASLLSSPARLTDPTALERFETIFLAHGVLGYRAADASGVGEAERLSVVPLVFGLLPANALLREVVRIKPLIEEHLAVLGVQRSDRLTTILKRIADHYAATSPTRPSWLSRPRKSSLAGVRLDSKCYRRIRDEQNGRCAICGVDLDWVPDAEEALDHIIPWRLVGDPPDGSNWRLLCHRCNGGKADYLSTLLMPAAWNWIYREGSGPDGAGEPDRATRYVVLAQRGRCTEDDCRNGPRDGQLFLQLIAASGLSVADNLRVVCDQHRQTAWQ